MEQKETNKNKVLFVIGGVLLAILVIGASFAYFQIVANNNATTTTISGEGELVGQGTLSTNISTLKLDVTAKMMHQDNIGKKYYASPTGDAIETSEVRDGNGRYTLATATITESEVALDCSYTYDISATTTNTITDSSDEDLKVIITETDGTRITYTLKQLLSGVTHTGKIKRLTYGRDQTIQIEAYIENTSDTQNNLSGNSYTITITPKSGNEGFSCDLLETLVKKAKGQAIAAFMVENKEEVEGLWSSGLEGDGLRYVGSGTYDSETTPSNFICFGTTSKEECKANEDIYMYRIIGVFPDDEGNQHLKLRKLKQLDLIDVWHTSMENVTWGESSMYTNLNGSHFLTNTSYDYLQNSSWLNKIVDWKWTAVTTKQYDGGADYSYLTISEIYLHEMNRSTKTNSFGEWTYPEGKIGLIYASDYLLSLGDEALAMTGDVYSNALSLSNGWLYHLNNKYFDENIDEWLISQDGLGQNDYYYAWYIGRQGFADINKDYIDYTQRSITPVFYLESSESLSSGTGTYTDPYIIG